MGILAAIGGIGYFIWLAEAKMKEEKSNRKEVAAAAAEAARSNPPPPFVPMHR